MRELSKYFIVGVGNSLNKSWINKKFTFKYIFEALAKPSV